jgi:hypothetical protein
MTKRHDEPTDRDLLRALRRLADELVVPPVDPARERLLLEAFEAARMRPRRSRAAYWWMGAVASAAALLIAGAVLPVRHRQPVAPTHAAGERHDPTVVNEFVPWPGARELPPLESGVLMRVDLPVSMLPVLGIAPLTGHRTVVKADVIVGQDGLARAVRVVSN